MADSNIQTLDTVKPITLDEYQERTAHLQENTTSLLSTIADRQVQAAGLATQAASLASEVNAVAEQASLSFSKKTWTDTATSGTPITATELNRLENAISSLTTAVNNLQDSVSQARIKWKVPYSNDTIQLERIGRAVFCHGNVKFSSSVQCNYSTASEILPKGFRPLGANTPAVFSLAGNFALLFDENGKVSMLGNPDNAYACCTGSWVTGDPFPA